MRPPGTCLRISAGSSVKKVKVPNEPCMSGVPMPESDSPRWHSAGGKFTGMRMTLVRTPCSESVCQNGLPLRRLRTPPPESGIS
jgi:hypothetical protein